MHGYVAQIGFALGHPVAGVDGGLRGLTDVNDDVVAGMVQRAEKTLFGPLGPAPPLSEEGDPCQRFPRFSLRYGHEKGF